MTQQAMLQDLFDQQHSYLNYFFNKLDMQQVESMMALFFACKGVILFSGVGKSGIVAQKLATTMTSTGAKALFVSPTDALHGDLGIVGANDLFVLMSKSGESDELIQLLPYIKNKKAQTVAWVSNIKSRLAQRCDLAIELPLLRELCPFDLAPMTSAAIQMIFGDIVAVAMMKLRGFSLDQYAVNHPAGKIGKRITCKVENLMLFGDALPLCFSEDTLGSVLVELTNKRCGCLLVVNEHHILQGIFTDGDLGRALTTQGKSVLEEPIHKLMTMHPKTVNQNLLAWDAMKMMESDANHPISVLPVLEDEKVIGLIKMHDIVQTGL
jgi:arabinose-5-phosphate isomerase